MYLRAQQRWHVKDFKGGIFTGLRTWGFSRGVGGGVTISRQTKATGPGDNLGQNPPEPYKYNNGSQNSLTPATMPVPCGLYPTNNPYSKITLLYETTSTRACIPKAVLFSVRCCQRSRYALIGEERRYRYCTAVVLGLDKTLIYRQSRAFRPEEGGSELKLAS